MSVVVVSVTVSVSPWVSIVPTTAAPWSVTVTVSVPVSVSLVQQRWSPDVDRRVSISLKRGGLTSNQSRVFSLLVVVDLVS